MFVDDVVDVVCVLSVCEDVVMKMNDVLFYVDCVGGGGGDLNGVCGCDNVGMKCECV